MSLPFNNQADNTKQSSEVELRLRQQGVYPTPQRLAIAGKLLFRHQHVTAEQVYEMVNLGETPVSKATIYNTLSLFVDKGLLREIFIDANRTFYDSNVNHHQHFYNVDSGALIDMDVHVLPLIFENALPAGTTLEDVDVIVRVRNKRR